jgi:hypothetical protein
MKLDEFFEKSFEFGTFDTGNIVHISFPSS